MRRYLGALAMVVFAGCSSLSPANQDGDALAAMDKRLDVTHGDCRLVGYALSPGIEVKAVGCNCLKGPTLLAKVLYLPTGGVVATGGGGSEADPDVIIDFSQAPAGVYRFTQCTWDPRDANGDVPFIVRTVRVHADGSVAEKEEIVLKPEPGDQARLDELVRQAIQEPASNAGDDRADPRGEAMGRIRNIGIDKPDDALAAFAKLRGKVDGWVLEEKIDREDEILRVKELRSAGPKQGR